MIPLLTRLRTTLSKSIDAYETFCSSSRDLFVYPSVEGHDLQAVDDSFKGLRLGKKRLEYLVDRSSNFARIVRLLSSLTLTSCSLSNTLLPRSTNSD